MTSDSAAANGRNYIIITSLWLLQYIVFCLFWGHRVTVVVSQARNVVLANLSGQPSRKPELKISTLLALPPIEKCNILAGTDSSVKECFALSWQPFAAAMHLPLCLRRVLGTYLYATSHYLILRQGLSLVRKGSFKSILPSRVSTYLLN
jgi:hypothetical protein